MSNGKFQAQNQSQMVETTLGLLDAVNSEDGTSQRHLANRLGVALGLTNTLLKRCVKKGLLKIRQAPAKRFVYYLTPQGFKEKSRLTAEYLSSSLDFFRRARSEYADAMHQCRDRGWTRIALYGAGDLAEIAILSAREAGMNVTVIIQPGRNTDHFSDVAVVRNLDEANHGGALDAVIITDASDPQEIFATLQGRISTERILTPPLLHVMRDVEIEPDAGEGEAAQ